MEVDEQENELILARIGAATKGYNYGKTNDSVSPDLAKYTNAVMPEIQDEAPLSLLEGINKEQLLAWLQTATGKVLARPFDVEVKHQPNQVEIAKTLIAVANDITGQSNIAVAAPIRDKESSDGGRHPYTFLIHNLTPSSVHTLLERKVWSSTEISFRVSPINTAKPSFLFSLTGLLTPELAHVQNLVANAWKDPVTEAFVKNLVNRALPWQQHQLSIEIDNFLNSLTVTDIRIKSKGGQNDPHYNIYMDSKAIKDDQTWMEIREFLKARAYPSPLYGRGLAKKRPFYCSLCHSCDHPRGLCPFPNIPGWNGGNRRLPQTLGNTEPTLHQSHAFRSRPPPNGYGARPPPRKSI